MPNYRRLFIENSYVFITVVTNKRMPLLIDNVELLRKSFKHAMLTYKFDLFACAILPDHMHLIIIPEKIEEYPKIIRAIKYNFTQKFNAGGIAIPPYANNQSTTGLPSGKKQKIWQNRYFEHTIRNETDLNNHLDYIHYNPIKHGYVKAVKDWEFSSFDNFVKMKNYDESWGSCEDVKHIETLEYD